MCERMCEHVWMGMYRGTNMWENMSVHMLLFAGSDELPPPPKAKSRQTQLCCISIGMACLSLGESLEFEAEPQGEGGAWTKASAVFEIFKRLKCELATPRVEFLPGPSWAT